MQINLEIDDNILRRTVEEGITYISKEQLVDIVKQAITDYMNRESIVEKVCFNRDYYGNKTVLREDISSILKSSFSPDEVKKYREKLYKFAEENGRELFFGALAKSFIDMLVTDNFKNHLYNDFSVLNSAICQIKNDIKR